MTMTRNNWQKTTLGEIALIQKGSTITAKAAQPGAVPVIAGGKKAAYFHNEANRGAKTITVSASGAYAGYVSFHQAPIWASDCTTFEPKDSQTCLVEFLHYFMLARQDEIYSLQRGSGMPHVYAKDLAQIEMPLPPLEEQKRIVGALDDHLSRLDQALAAILSQKGKVSTVFQELIDRVYWSENLDFVPLKDFGAWVTGSTPSTKVPEYFGGDLPFVTPPEVKNSQRVSATKRSLTQAGALQVRVLDKPCIHLVCIGTVGKLGFSEGASATNQQITSLMPGDTVDFEYALDLFSSQEAQRRFRSASGKSNMPMLTKGSLLKIEMPLPTLETQRRLRLQVGNLRESEKTAVELIYGIEKQILQLKTSILHAAFIGKLGKSDE